VALYATKIVTFMKNGFWGTLHEARTDVSMLLGLIFLLVVGGGTLGPQFEQQDSFSGSNHERMAMLYYGPLFRKNLEKTPKPKDES
jgi:hypothetical protein